MRHAKAITGKRVTAMKPSPVSATVPFDVDGVHHGHLRLPYSRDDSAWGSVMIPVTVVRNGSGPTALLTGANHGDEYEGPIALLDLALNISPEDVSGRIIMVPAAYGWIATRITVPQRVMQSEYIFGILLP